MNISQPKSLHHYMQVYKNLISQGELPKAYKGIMKYMRELRVHFHHTYPELTVAGSIYPGNMDYTFFSLSSPKLKKEKLKVLIIFSHATFEFEAWLAGQNKSIQKKYWDLLRQSSWEGIRIPDTIKHTESILEKSLAKDPNFDKLPALTQQIEKGIWELIEGVEAFLHT